MALALVLLPSACSRPRVIEREGGTLVLAMPGSLAVLDPHRAPAENPMLRAVYDTLLTMGPDSAIEPGLAESWTVAADGLRVDLELRQGVVFHDGSKLDGLVVTRNLERIMAGDVAQFPIKRLLGPLREVSAAGLKVSLHFERPFPPVFSALADARLGLISAGSLAATESAEGPLAERVVGTGPYALAAAAPGVVDLVQNALYAWPPPRAVNPGAPYPEGIQVVFVDAAAEGTADAAEGPGGFDLIWWPAGEPLPEDLDRQSAGWRTESWGGERMVYLAPLGAGGPFVEPAVREALASAVDREAVAAGLPWPAAPATYLLPPGVPGHLAGDPPGSSAAAARDALDGAGWVRDEDGQRRRGGEHLEVRLATYEGDEVFAALAENVRGSLEALGVPCRLVPPRRALQPGLVGGAPNLWLLYYEWPDPDVLYYLLHSSQVGQANRAAYRNDAVDQLLFQARGEMDDKARSELYQRVQRQIAEDTALIPLAAAMGQVRVGPDVVDYRPTDRRFLWLGDLYLRGEARR